MISAFTNGIQWVQDGVTSFVKNHPIVTTGVALTCVGLGVRQCRQTDSEDELPEVNKESWPREIKILAKGGIFTAQQHSWLTALYSRDLDALSNLPTPGKGEGKELFEALSQAVGGDYLPLREVLNEWQENNRWENCEGILFPFCDQAEIWNGYVGMKVLLPEMNQHLRKLHDSLPVNSDSTDIVQTIMDEFTAAIEAKEPAQMKKILVTFTSDREILWSLWTISDRLRTVQGAHEEIYKAWEHANTDARVGMIGHCSGPKETLRSQLAARLTPIRNLRFDPALSHNSALRLAQCEVAFWEHHLTQSRK
jgi:hypothetical protein